MQRTYRVQSARLGLVALLAMLVLLACPGTSIAGGTSGTTRSAESGTALLQRGSGYSQPAGGDAARVKALQRSLRRLGWQPGPVDGLFGPLTEAAVVRFQQNTQVAVDGIVGPQTTRALTSARTTPLRRGVGYAEPDGSPRVRQLQTRLRSHGVNPGPVDGIFGPRTEAALTRFQRAGGVPATGVVTQPTGRLLAGIAQPTGNARADEKKSRRVAERKADKSPKRVAASLGTETVGATTGDSSGNDDVDVPLLITAGLLALLVGALLGLVLSRLRAGGGGDTAIPLAHNVVAEGWSKQPEIGPFRGRVHALVLGRGSLWRSPETRYLVSDPRKKGPFWVTHEEVSRLVAPPETTDQPRPRDPERVATDEVKVIGYASVTAAEQADPSHVEEQADAIASHCEENGWDLVEVVRDVEPLNDHPLERPGVRYAFDRIGSGAATCLVTAQLGRLSHSAIDLSRILEALGTSGARLVALDVGLDTASSDARVAINALTAMGGWDRRAATPARAAALRAVQPQTAGRVAEDPIAVKERIAEMREGGMTLQAIADQLNDEGVPTLGGGTKWRPSSVRYAVASVRRDKGGA